jgi:serine/threonine-protein kinase RsbW
MSDRMQAQASMVKELEIASDPDNLILVEGFIDEIRSALDFRDDVYGNVLVAITEAVNNSIHHGNQGDVSKRVFIRCEAINPYRIQVKVEDEGPGFDWQALPDPTAPENIEKAGGRGVFLMSHLSDDIRFEESGRRVVMLFNI